MIKIKLVLIFIVLSTLRAIAYPDFIGMGYTSCLTCHYNGAGHGALNDYGRGLFASEIASQSLWDRRKTSEELVEKSGFLGSVQWPYWFRPSAKFRGLALAPIAKDVGRNSIKTYLMQRDLNLHLPFNEDQTILLGFNIGMVTDIEAAYPNRPYRDSLLVSREYYLRGQFGEGLWIYLGYLDKVFGIRHPDHTATNRSPLGIGANDQVHGLIVHKVFDNSELFFQSQSGNVHLPAKERRPGFSIHYEYEPAEKWRVGTSYLTQLEENRRTSQTGAIILKRGIQNGHSLLMESGLRQKKGTNGLESLSAYLWSQATIKLVQGYFFQSNFEYSKANLKGLEPESLRWTFGLLSFPLSRVEFRLSAQTTRTIDPEEVSIDSWYWLSQLHFSF